jgi:DNA-binding GntR family transcriptional regulator
MTNQSPIARHHVREELQRRILSGETRPGERLTQQSLARELGVAQGTVRESLLELQWLGLVESVDRLGVFVGNLDSDRLCEAYQVRELLEGLASRSACMHAGRADVAELRRMADDVWELAGQGKFEEMGAADRAFHLQIMRLSRNKILIRLAEGYRVLSMAVRASRDPRVVYEEHLRIVDAIDNNLPEEAERIARTHVEGARRMIEQQVAEGKFTPLWVMDAKTNGTTMLKG